MVGVRPESIADLIALGAGNCNDLALNKLGAAFRTINLVDIGRTAVEYGMQQQSFVGFIGLNVVAPCDGAGWFGADSPPRYLADLRRLPPDPPIAHGSMVITVTDFTSSEACPELLTTGRCRSCHEFTWLVAKRQPFYRHQSCCFIERVDRK